MKYVCTNCEAEHLNHRNLCTKCGSIGTIVEVPVINENKNTSLNKSVSKSSTVQNIMRVTTQDAGRIDTGMTEFNRVMSNGTDGKTGIVLGSVTLLGGDAGIGKSTLLTQLAMLLHANNYNPLYVAAEENLGQIQIRVKRLLENGVMSGHVSGDFLAVFENTLEVIEHHINSVRPDILIIDSLQTVGSSEVVGDIGRDKQTRYVAHWATQWAKSNNIPVILVGQVTKDGDITGSNSIIHLVDAVLYFEGEEGGRYRFLRSQKNRNGSQFEVGVFEMTGRGLIEVPNPSVAFLSERQVGVSGSGVTTLMDGFRPILTEIQALCVEGNGGNPSRKARGFSLDNLHKILATIQKHIYFANFNNENVFVNVAGQLTIGKQDTSSDLSVAVALISSLIDEPIPYEIITIAELGLGSELRRVPNIEARIREANLVGFEKVIVPPLGDDYLTKSGLDIKIVECKTLWDALEAVFYNIDLSNIVIDEDDE